MNLYTEGVVTGTAFGQAFLCVVTGHLLAAVISIAGGFFMLFIDRQRGLI